MKHSWLASAQAPKESSTSPQNHNIRLLTHDTGTDTTSLTLQTARKNTATGKMRSIATVQTLAQRSTVGLCRPAR